MPRVADIAQLHLAEHRCPICGLPLPRGATASGSAHKTSTKTRTGTDTPAQPANPAASAEAADPAPITCSRRCASRAALSRDILGPRREQLTRDILAQLATLRDGTTLCPGELSRRVLPGIEDPLRLLRPLLHALAEEGRLRLSQKGTILPWRKIRGPFRLRPGR